MLFNKGERYALTECNLMLLRGMAPKKLKSVATGVEGEGNSKLFLKTGIAMGPIINGHYPHFYV